MVMSCHCDSCYRVTRVSPPLTPQKEDPSVVKHHSLHTIVCLYPTPDMTRHDTSIRWLTRYDMTRYYMTQWHEGTEWHVCASPYVAQYAHSAFLSSSFVFPLSPFFSYWYVPVTNAAIEAPSVFLRNCKSDHTEKKISLGQKKCDRALNFASFLLLWTRSHFSPWVLYHYTIPDIPSHISRHHTITTHP